ncbi:MAG: leucine-rich repeat domain-containing protein [Clostridiales bacterium]|nr:leucine-rich repeat domain-containing protein [Clostridiales bacterium]
MKEREPVYCPTCMELQSGNATTCPACGHPLQVENEVHQLSVGTVLRERYLVGKVLGEGGFGITYIGMDLTLDAKVAIKEYYPTSAANRHHSESADISVNTGLYAEQFEQGKAKFLTEARTLAKFSTEPSIVGVRDFFQENRTAYIIMDFLEGVNLGQYLQTHGPMSFQECFALLQPVMDAMGKVHAQGLIHRDISPSNLMLLNSGTVKLLDFGTARAVDYTGGNSVSVILKPGYAPEEQYLSHGSQGPWTDVYALCATIYKLITGKTPENAMNRLSHDTLACPSSLGADIPPAQERVLMKGLAVRREDRIQSMDELKQSFLRAATAPVEPVAVEDDERTMYGPGSVAPVQPTPASEPQPSKDVPSERQTPKETPSKEEKKKKTPKKEKRSTGRKGGKGKLLLLLIPVALVALLLGWIFLGGESVGSGSTSSMADFYGETITSSMLSGIARNKNVTTLYFSGCEISDEIIDEIAQMQYIEDISFKDGCTGYSSLDPLAGMESLEDLTLEGSEKGGSEMDGEGLFTVDFPSVKNLYIRRYTFTSGSSFLGHFTGLVYLTVMDSSGIDDLSCLSGIPKLQTLNLSRSDLSAAEMPQLSACENLRSLTAESCGLSSISWMEGAPSLSLVYLNDNQIQSLEPLATVTKLSRLEMENNQVQELTGLESHDSLSVLDLSGNQLTDVSLLGEIESLTTLDISDNQISDVSALSGCKSIENLYMNDNQIDSLSLCQEMIHLETLEAMNNQISELTGLENVTQLKSVWLSGNQISDISLLTKSQEHLEIVKISNNQISDLSPLQDCALLATLMASDNQISDLSPLQGKTSLYLLTVNNNQMTNLDALSDCTSLYYLSAHGNQITDISGLSGCPSLYYIDLGENEISDITPLAASMVSRWILLLQNNQISDISALPLTVQYIGLSLYNNPISDFSPIGDMTVSNGTLYVSWVSGWDYSPIAGSTFSIMSKNLVDVPLDQQAETENTEREARGVSSLTFLTLEEADEDIDEFRKKYGPDEYATEEEDESVETDDEGIETEDENAGTESDGQEEVDGQ